MDIISLEQSDRLYWLGRYTERVFTTTSLFFKTFDTMIDTFQFEYQSFCTKLDIPNIYSDADDFCTRYTFDETDTNSLISNLLRAYDNAIVLREEISSAALSYIQLAIYEMQKAKESESPLVQFQSVLDNLMAFWGTCDDAIQNPIVRNILKLGKRIERIDLYARLKKPISMIKNQMDLLLKYLESSKLKYKEQTLKVLQKELDADNPDYRQLVILIEDLI